MSARPILTAVACLALGSALGYITSWSRTTSPQGLARRIAHGDADDARVAADIMIEEKEAGAEQLSLVFVDYRGREAISTENTLIVVDTIRRGQRSCGLKDLAMGALQASDPAVRKECVSALRAFHNESWWASISVVTKSLPAETDELVLRQKRDLLTDLLFPGDAAEDVAGLATQEFGKRCMTELMTRKSSR